MEPHTFKLGKHPAKDDVNITESLPLWEKPKITEINCMSVKAGTYVSTAETGACKPAS